MPREQLHTLLAERLHHIISSLASGLSREEVQGSANWFASTMMYLIELYTTDWKEPTFEEMQETLRELRANLLLLEAFEETPQEE